MPTWTGTNGADNITRPAGSNSQDTIYGLGGNDTLDGADNDDLIEGGYGSDRIIGASGVDTLRGGAGGDTIDAGAGNDLVDGGSNNDSILAGEGTNTVYGGSGHDTITAGSGVDVIYGDKNPADTLPGGQFDYQAYVYQTNFTHYGGPSALHNYLGMVVSGAPITVTFLDDDPYLRTDDGPGATNDAFNEPNQFVVINGVQYPVYLEQIVTYVDASGQQYQFLQVDFDYNLDGTSNQGNTPAGMYEQGGLQVLLSSPPPPVGATLTVVPGSIDAIHDHEYDANYNDVITSGAGNDRVFGQLGNDTIDAGDGNDSVDGGAGSDSILGGTGDDTILGDGSDTVGGADTVDGGTGVDNIQGGAGNDSLAGGADNDLIDGGTGNDSIDGGTGGDQLFGMAGDDTLRGGDGADILNGGADNDLLDGGAGGDILNGGAGNDSLLGGTGEDVLGGGDGNDTMDGGAGADQLAGGSGNDQIIAGLGDGAVGDNDRDTFTLYAVDGDTGVFTVNGSTGSTAAGDVDDYDSIVLGPGLSFVTGSMQKVQDEGGVGLSYTGTFQVTDGQTVYTVNFQEIENLPICFVRGSQIETISGPRPVEALRAGDLIRTRDNGFMPIRWIGSRVFANDHSDNMQTIGPIRVAAGALGEGLPLRDLYLSPQHRVLVRSRIARRMFGADEVLVAVKHLLELPGIEPVADFAEVEYFHILFDQHEIITANGLEAESLHTGPMALQSLDAAALEEVFAIFPELADPTPDALRAMARPVPKGKLARQLAHRHVKHGVPLQ